MGRRQPAFPSEACPWTRVTRRFTSSASAVGGEKNILKPGGCQGLAGSGTCVNGSSWFSRMRLLLPLPVHLSDRFHPIPRVQIRQPRQAARATITGHHLDQRRLSLRAQAHRRGWEIKNKNRVNMFSVSYTSVIFSEALVGKLLICRAGKIQAQKEKSPAHRTSAIFMALGCRAFCRVVRSPAWKQGNWVFCTKFIIS